MLVYHPAYDAHHCLFRLVTILESRQSIEIDRLRILDFVLCFPAVIDAFKLPQNAASIRKAAKLSKNVYRTPLNLRTTFGSLSASQDGALACLAAAGFVSKEGLASGLAVRTPTAVPAELLQHCNKLRNHETLFFMQILPLFIEIPLLGHNGLKARSGLLEYRYDSV
jgi:hypothetical protein